MKPTKSSRSSSSMPLKLIHVLSPQTFLPTACGLVSQSFIFASVQTKFKLFSLGFLLPQASAKVPEGDPMTPKRLGPNILPLPSGLIAWHCAQLFLKMSWPRLRLATVLAASIAAVEGIAGVAGSPPVAACAMAQCEIQTEPFLL